MVSEMIKNLLKLMNTYRIQILAGQEIKQKSCFMKNEVKPYINFPIYDFNITVKYFIANVSRVE